MIKGRDGVHDDCPRGDDGIGLFLSTVVKKSRNLEHEEGINFKIFINRGEEITYI